MDINYNKIPYDDINEEDFGSDELSTLKDTKEGSNHSKIFFNSEIFSTLSGDKE